MSTLPNSHQALLRNSERLRGDLAILGPTDPALLDSLPQGGLVMTEQAGTSTLLVSHANWVVAFGYDDTALSSQIADTVVIFVPKSRSELSLRLALALSLVKAGGRLLLVGEKKEGVARAVRQLSEQLPQSEKVDSARHCQVWQADGVSCAADFELADWMQWHEIERHAVRLAVAGLPGIFSDGELDAGTGMLLDSLADSPLRPGAVLDFACGAGVIGAWLQCYQAQRSVEVFPVDGVDVQFQAVTCARATYERAGVNGVIHASDGLDRVDGRYRNVVTNPPFHTGLHTDTSVTDTFIKNLGKHLVSGGELRVVANRFLPYEALIRRYIGQPRVLAEDRRFIVWAAVKP